MGDGGGPHPPLWVACSRRETIHFAARNGIGALSFSFIEPEDAGKWVDSSEVARARRARRPSGVLPALVNARDQLRENGQRRVRKAAYRFVGNRSDSRLERRFGPSTQRFFFTGMARAYDPKAGRGFQGELEFRLSRTDGTAMVWTIEVRDGRARSRPGPARKPALTISTGTADFLRTLSGHTNPAALLMDGRLKLTGDSELAPRIAEMFGGPSPY